MLKVQRDRLDPLVYRMSLVRQGRQARRVLLLQVLLGQLALRGRQVISALRALMVLQVLPDPQVLPVQRLP